MLAEDRLNAIVSMVQQAGSVTVPELAEALGVTPSTIPRLANARPRAPYRQGARRRDESGARARDARSDDQRAQRSP